jgi:phosphoribosylformimino-5-aminoimidazole carboxamide ribonucleotide (ProFAR) isomerase
MNGKAVQLVQGEKMALQAPEDPIALAKQFGVTGEVAVIDLDAAMGQGDNRDLIKTLCRHAPCRVGGGIRSLEAASDWLNAGAVKVILGTKAEPAILSQLPRDRVMAAVDMRGGKVAVEGWKTVQETAGLTRMVELRDWVGGFLVTNIDIEGTMGGFDTASVAPILDAAATVKLTMAGGITTAQQIAELDKMGVDAQVGMALYTGKLTIADCLAAMMISDRADGLWPTVVVDSNHQALGLVYSNGESLRAALAEGRAFTIPDRAVACGARVKLQAPARNCCGLRWIATATPCNSRCNSWAMAFAIWARPVVLRPTLTAMAVSARWRSG